MRQPFAAQRRSLITAGLVSALTTISNIALLATSAWLIARATQMPPVLTLTVAVVSVRALALFRSVGRYTERLVSHDATFKSLATLRSEVYSAVERLAPDRLGRMRRGDVVARLVSDVDRMQDLPLRVWLPGAASAISAIITCGVTAMLLPAAGLALTLCMVVAAIVAPKLAVRAAAASEATLAGDLALLTDDVLEFLDGQTDLAMLDAMPRALDALEARDAVLRQAGQRLAKGNGIATATLVVSQSVAIALSVWVAAQAVASGALGAVESVVVAMIPLAAFESVASLPSVALAQISVAASWKRIAEVLQAAQAVTDDAPSHAVTSALAPHVTGDVAARAVSAAWTGGSPIPAVSLHAPAGSITAITGPSGSGKSTFLAVLAGLIRPTHGSYLLDRVDTSHLSGTTIRQHVTLSLQDAHIFTTSVAENVRLAARPGTEISDDDVAATLDAVGLGPWLEGLPHGLNTVLVGNGASMSGGQRQRLLAARMVVANPDVWLLDEPTEHLDALAADDLLAYVIRMAAGRTIIFSTHQDADLAQAQTTVTIGGTMES